MTNKLSDILKNEYKTKGLVSGLGSALGKSALEKIDLRNLLFSGSGVGAMIGQKAFGKGYSATRSGSTTEKLNTAELSNSPTNVLNEQSLEYLDQIALNTKISAKNSLALPSMARDMFLMKQNIVKLVKLQGGTPTTKAGDWFSRQAAREAAFESKYNKSPSKISSGGSTTGKPESGSGILGSLLGAGSLLGLIFSPLSGIVKGLTGSFGGLVKILGGISLSLLRFGGVIGSILLWLVKSKIGRILGLAGVLMMGKNAMAGTGEDSEGGGFSLPGLPDINDDTTIFDSKKFGNSVDESVSSFKQSGTGNYAAGALAAVGAARFGAAALRLGTATGTTLLDVRTQSIGQLTKATPKSFWGRFLQFLAKRNSKLFAQVGLRLAQATTLAAIPVVGWIGALISLGFTLWTAWEIYELWREFIKDEDESTANTSKAPTGVTTKETGNEARVTAETTQSAASTSNLTQASQSTQNMSPQQRGEQPNSNNVSLDTRIRNVQRQIDGLPPGKQREERQRVLDGLLKEKNSGVKYNPPAATAPSEDPLDIRIESLQRQIDALPNGPARDILKKTQQDLKIRKAGKSASVATPIDQRGANSPAPVTKQDMANLIRTRFKEAGFSDVQAEAAVANAIAESGLDPSLKSRGPGEDSWGLFQLNRNGGEGSGYTPEQLQDPETNIKIAIAAMKKPDQGRRFRAATTIPEAVAAFVQDFERPSDQSVAAINRRIEIANNNRGSVIDGASTAIASGGRGGVNNVYADNSVTNNNVNNNGGGSSGSAEIADFDFLQLIGAAGSKS